MMFDRPYGEGWPSSPCPMCGRVEQAVPIEVPDGQATRGPWVPGSFRCSCCDAAAVRCPHRQVPDGNVVLHSDAGDSRWSSIELFGSDAFRLSRPGGESHGLDLRDEGWVVVAGVELHGTVVESMQTSEGRAAGGYDRSQHVTFAVTREPVPLA